MALAAECVADCREWSFGRTGRPSLGQLVDAVNDGILDAGDFDRSHDEFRI